MGLVLEVEMAAIRNLHIVPTVTAVTPELIRKYCK